MPISSIFKIALRGLRRRIEDADWIKYRKPLAKALETAIAEDATGVEEELEPELASADSPVEIEVIDTEVEPMVPAEERDNE